MQIVKNADKSDYKKTFSNFINSNGTYLDSDGTYSDRGAIYHEFAVGCTYDGSPDDESLFAI